MWAEHPEKYDADGNLLLPEKGIVTFTLEYGRHPLQGTL